MRFMAVDLALGTWEPLEKCTFGRRGLLLLGIMQGFFLESYNMRPTWVAMLVWERAYVGGLCRTFSFHQKHVGRRLKY